MALQEARKERSPTPRRALREAPVGCMNQVLKGHGFSRATEAE
jgi:hypothetical protein